VRALEEEYGVSLLKAHGHTVRLTEDGERLMELAAPLVEGFESLKRLFADSQARAGRVLRLTAPPTIFTGLLDKLLNVYRKLHPEVRLSMIECSSREAWELVVADKADLAVVGAPEGLEHHPFAKIKQPTLQDFINQPLILAGEKSSSRIQLNLFVSKAGLQNQLNVVMLATSVQLMLNCVALGIGVAMVTRLATDSISIPAEQATSLVYRDISSLLGSENIALVSRRGRFELPHIQAFREVVLSMRIELQPKPPATKKPRRS
jgi:DNA-binding transcriptional LysR family regulator